MRRGLPGMSRRAAASIVRSATSNLLALISWGGAPAGVAGRGAGASLHYAQVAGFAAGALGEGGGAGEGRSTGVASRVGADSASSELEAAGRKSSGLSELRAAEPTSPFEL